MIFTPHPYQSYCIERLLQASALGLYIDMGLGKSVITLTAINELRRHRFCISKALIIAPKKVAEATWQAEASKWCISSMSSPLIALAVLAISFASSMLFHLKGMKVLTKWNHTTQPLGLNISTTFCKESNPFHPDESHTQPLGRLMENSSFS